MEYLGKPIPNIYPLLFLPVPSNTDRHADTYTHGHTYAPIHTHAPTHMHARMHTCRHTHMRTHISTNWHFSSERPSWHRPATFNLGPFVCLSLYQRNGSQLEGNMEEGLPVEPLLPGHCTWCQHHQPLCMHILFVTPVSGRLPRLPLVCP